MSAQSQSEREALANDESRLRELQREEAAIENENHDGFRDATRLSQVKYEIDDLETDIFRENVQIENDNR